MRPERLPLRPLLERLSDDVECDPELHVEADPMRLAQAIGNLVDNAQRHGEGRVRITVEPDGERVAIHVRDEGPGFPDEFRVTAFDRFTRADSAREGGGAGLGLSIVAAIADAHGGTAGIGTGGDVWVTVP